MKISITIEKMEISIAKDTIDIDIEKIGQGLEKAVSEIFDTAIKS